MYVLEGIETSWCQSSMENDWTGSSVWPYKMTSRWTIRPASVGASEASKDYVILSEFIWIQAHLSMLHDQRGIVIKQVEGYLTHWYQNLQGRKRSWNSNSTMSTSYLDTSFHISHTTWISAALKYVIPGWIVLVATGFEAVAGIFKNRFVRTEYFPDRQY